MNYNEALTKNALLNEAGAVKNLGAKAMTEKILMGLHYRKAVEEWLKAREAITGDATASEEVKRDAMEKKTQEDCGLCERRMSAEAFGQLVEAVMQEETMPSFLAGAPGEDGGPGRIASEVWLHVFAEQLVEI